MLIVALVLAVIGLAALVTAIVTSNELIAWVCIGASGLGILLLVADAIRDRARRRSEFPAAVGLAPEETTEVMGTVVSEDTSDDQSTYSAESFGEETEQTDETEESADIPEDFSEDFSEDIPEDIPEDIAAEDHPEELIHDEPDYDLPSDDEADFPEAAEEAAVHTITESELVAETEDEDTARGVEYTYSGDVGTEYVDTGDSPDGEERRDQ